MASSSQIDDMKPSTIDFIPHHPNQGPTNGENTPVPV